MLYLIGLAYFSTGGDPPDLLDVAATNEGDVMPVIRKKEREYMGMFEYDRRDEMQIIRVLVYGMLNISLVYCSSRCLQLTVPVFCAVNLLFNKPLMNIGCIKLCKSTQPNKIVCFSVIPYMLLLD